MYGICRTVMLLGLLLAGVLRVGAQSSSAAQSANPASAPAAAPDKQSTSQQPALPGGVSSEDKNRREFEKNAGEQAAKLLLRSSPSDAEVLLNGLFVGKTPLLLIVAPGKYTVDMRGPRQEFEHRAIGVMPKETQTVLMKLNQQYPASLGVRWPGQ